MGCCVGGGGVADQEIIEVTSSALSLCMPTVLDLVWLCQGHNALGEGKQLKITLQVNFDCTSGYGIFELFPTSNHLNGNLLNVGFSLPTALLALCRCNLLANIPICHHKVLKPAIGHHHRWVDQVGPLCLCQTIEVLFELRAILVPAPVEGFGLGTVPQVTWQAPRYFSHPITLIFKLWKHLKQKTRGGLTIMILDKTNEPSQVGFQSFWLCWRGPEHLKIQDTPDKISSHFHSQCFFVGFHLVGDVTSWCCCWPLHDSPCMWLWLLLLFSIIIRIIIAFTWHFLCWSIHCIPLINRWCWWWPLPENSLSLLWIFGLRCSFLCCLRCWKWWKSWQLCKHSCLHHHQGLFSPRLSSHQGFLGWAIWLPMSVKSSKCGQYWHGIIPKMLVRISVFFNQKAQEPLGDETPIFIGFFAKVHQKCTKRAPKVHQKCTKSAPKVHQKCTNFATLWKITNSNVSRTQWTLAHFD